ncbi:cytosine/adenosine deaminase-related metal-dependent hydrolase [Neorhizobium galegae]|nr:cytosine/adenosine deaminase-related metal-dependent hydrolase [Neorhizobium galegae]
MDTAIADMDEGDVLFENEKIVAVGRDLEVPANTEIIDASGMIVMPGLVNAHIHTWQTALRSVGGNFAGTNYVDAVHSGLATHYKPSDIYIGNLVGALNQIDSGVTTIVDWCHNNPTPDYTDNAISALDEVGIRALFLHGSAKPPAKPGTRPYFEVPMNRDNVKRLREGRFSGDDGLLTLGIAVLGPQISVLDVTIEDFKLARDFNLIASLHHSNAKMRAPDGYVIAAEEGLLSDRINIVHGNQLTDRDFNLLVDKGATFVVTAEAEMKGGYGEPLSGRLINRGANVPIGSDTEVTYAPDMFACMRMTLQQERHRASLQALAETGEKPKITRATTREALRWATLDGAKMAHLDHKIGSLTPGKQADIVMLRKTDLNMASTYDPINAIVLHANPGNVDTVIIAGKIKKAKGRLEYRNIGSKLDILRQSGERIIQEFLATTPAVGAVFRRA